MGGSPLIDVQWLCLLKFNNNWKTSGDKFKVLYQLKLQPLLTTDFMKEKRKAKVSQCRSGTCETFKGHFNGPTWPQHSNSHPAPHCYSQFTARFMKKGKPIILCFGVLCISLEEQYATQVFLFRVENVTDGQVENMTDGPTWLGQKHDGRTDGRTKSDQLNHS